MNDPLDSILKVLLALVIISAFIGLIAMLFNGAAYGGGGGNVVIVHHWWGYHSWGWGYHPWHSWGGGWHHGYRHR